MVSVSAATVPKAKSPGAAEVVEEASIAAAEVHIGMVPKSRS